MKHLKRILFFTFMALLFVVLIGKFSNWFLNYSDKTNKILNTAMFFLIGIGFLGFTLAFENKLTKGIVAICGIYLMTMYFIPEFYGKTIIGIICTLTPFLMAKFLLKEDSNK